MRSRLLLTVVLASALMALLACSGNEPAPQSTAESETAPATTQTGQSATAAPPVETSPAEAPAPANQLDGSACVDVTGANLDLAVATNPDDAREAADILERYDPPADVRNAIEHFASTGGPQFDDPDYEQHNSLIDNWVKQVCPL